MSLIYKYNTCCHSLGFGTECIKTHLLLSFVCLELDVYFKTVGTKKHRSNGRGMVLSETRFENRVLMMSAHCCEASSAFFPSNGRVLLSCILVRKREESKIEPILMVGGKDCMTKPSCVGGMVSKLVAFSLQETSLEPLLLVTQWFAVTYWNFELFMCDFWIRLELEGFCVCADLCVEILERSSLLAFAEKVC